MRRTFATTALFVLTVAFLPTAQGGKVKVWHHQTPGQHEKANFKHAVLSSEGTLRLAKQLKPLANLKVAHVWDVIEDQAGNLIVATGNEGKVFKVTPDGKTTVLHEAKESQVFCLALAPDGSIYAGTGPNGHILRITPDGQSRVLLDTTENYVWSLALDSKGENLYAGTGPKGRIYKLTTQGKGGVFCTTKQEHVLCVALGQDGNLYAGTDKNGVVYRIDSKGKGFVLYQTSQTEVRSLLVTPQGVLVGTSVPSRKRTGSSSSSSSGSSGSGTISNPLGTPGKLQAADGVEESDKGTSSASSSSSKDKEEKGTPAPSASPPSSGENSVYLIRSDGTVRELFREKAMVLSMVRQNGRLLLGTGMEGRLFEVDEATKERSEIARLDHGQIQTLCKRRDGSLVIGTGDPGRLYVLQDHYASKGAVTSDVLDAKLLSKWGSLRWKAQVPAGTGVSLSLRSGNVAEPDDTWSEWSAEQVDAEQGLIAAPTARYLQYRVTLTTTNPSVTPSVQSVTLRYMTANQAPEITNIEVPDLDAVNLDNPKKLKIKWTATDPNEDELTYSLYIRKDGWKSWVQLEDSLTKTEYEWDTTTTPAGMYQVKVVASDQRDNPSEEALTSERISASVAVAHVPPTVTIKVVGMDGDQALIEASASDPLVRLTGASFSVNGKKWVNVFPTDGLFDSKTENFKFKTDALKPGSYVVVLRVRDAAGNVGSGDVVFTVQPKAAKP